MNLRSLWASSALAVCCLGCDRAPLARSPQEVQHQVRAELLSRSPHWKDFAWVYCNPEGHDYSLLVTWEGSKTYTLLLTANSPYSTVQVYRALPNWRMGEKIALLRCLKDKVVESRWPGETLPTQTEKHLLTTLAGDLVQAIERADVRP
jgi:hypothetical protein